MKECTKTQHNLKFLPFKSENYSALDVCMNNNALQKSYLNN